MKDEVLISIDPGINGAFAIFVNGNLVKTGRVPVCKLSPKKRGIDIPKLKSDILNFLPTTDKIYLIFENVYAFPKQGVTSTATLMEAKGTIRGLLYGLFFVEEVLVRPSVWKRDLNLGQSKSKSLQLARQLFQQPFKDHNQAEAALLGYWFFNFHNKTNSN